MDAGGSEADAWRQARDRRVRRQPGRRAADLRRPPARRQDQDFGQQAELEIAPGADAQEILKALVNSGARISHFELASPSLHKIFVDLVGPEAATAAAVPGHAERVGAGA